MRTVVRKVRPRPTAAETRFADDWKRAVNDLALGMNEREVLAALRSGDRAAVVAAFDWPRFERALSVLSAHLSAAVDVGGQAVGLGIRFDLANPRAIAWSDQNAARLVVETSQLQQQAIRDIATRALTGEFDVRDAAQAIRGVVGLHTRYANAVFSYHLGLIEDGMGGDQAAMLADRYAVKLRNLRADTIARTEIMSAQNAGRREGWQQAMDAGLVSRQESRKQWLTTDDERTCPQCQALDSEIVGIDAVFSDGSPDPPAHPDCVVAGTDVSGPPFVAATMRRYEGDLVSFRTTRGHELTVTPNHPVLTPEGWVAAGSLYEGVNVISHESRDAASLRPDDQQVPSLVEEVSRAWEEQPSVFAVEMPTATEDFHGDGGHGDVRVVRPDGFLSDGVEAKLPELLPKPFLGGRHLSETFGGGGVSLALLERGATPASGFVSGSGPCPPLLGSALPEHQAVRLGEAASGDTLLTQDAVDDPAADPVRLGESLDRYAGTVGADKVIEVRRFPASTHVYNLQSQDGWFLAGGIVAHNCRCVTMLLSGVTP